MGNPLPYDEKFLVLVGPDSAAPADPEAPTTTELSALTEITKFIPKDGVNFGVTNNKRDSGSLATSFGADSQGTWKSALSLVVKRMTPVADDDAFTMLSNRGDRFCVVFVPFGDATAVGDPAYVYSNVEVGTPVPGNPAENRDQTVTIDFAAGDPAPTFTAVIAA